MWQCSNKDTETTGKIKRLNFSHFMQEITDYRLCYLVAKPHFIQWQSINHQNIHVWGQKIHSSIENKHDSPEINDLFVIFWTFKPPHICGADSGWHVLSEYTAHFIISITEWRFREWIFQQAKRALSYWHDSIHDFPHQVALHCWISCTGSHDLVPWSCFLTPAVWQCTCHLLLCSW